MNTYREVKKWYDRLCCSTRKEVFIDTETTGLRARAGDMPFMIACGTYAGDTICIEFPVDPLTRRVTYRRHAESLTIIRDVCEDAYFTKIGHNFGFDMGMLETHCDIHMQGRVEDTMIFAHVVNNIEPTYKLKALAATYCGVSIDDEKDLKMQVMRCRRVAKMQGWTRAADVEADYWLPHHLDPDNKLCETYCRLDVQRTALLWRLYTLHCDTRTRTAYEFELDVWAVVRKMERRGVAVKMDRLNRLIAENTQAREQALTYIRKQASDVNLDSPKQLSHFIFKVLKLPVQDRTPAGALSVNKSFLKKYYGKHDFITQLVIYRSAEKALQFYHNYKKLCVYEHDEYFLYPHFKQVEARTHRFSCTDPNLQNVADPESGRQLLPIQGREVFGPREGYVWLFADYKQIEIVIYAIISRDTSMIDAIQHGKDVHSINAQRIWGGLDNDSGVTLLVDDLEWYERTASSDRVHTMRARLGWNTGRDPRAAAREYLNDWFAGDILAAEAALGKDTARKRGKNMIFNKIYGGGLGPIMQYVRCDRNTAHSIATAFNRGVPSVQRCMRETEQVYIRQGYLLTEYGRKLYVESDRLYKGVNYRVQGTAAELLKRAMIRVDNLLSNLKIDAHIVLTIHDELIIEINTKEMTPWLPHRIQKTMEHHGGVLPLPTHIDLALTETVWSEKRKLTPPQQKNLRPS